MYQKKYLKYKEKYLNLKKQLNKQFGGVVDYKEYINDDFIVPTSTHDKTTINLRFMTGDVVEIHLPKDMTMGQLKKSLFKNTYEVLKLVPMGNIVSGDEYDDTAIMKIIEEEDSPTFRITVKKLE
jgi:hypothetical protein